MRRRKWEGKEVGEVREAGKVGEVEVWKAIERFR